MSDINTSLIKDVLLFNELFSLENFTKEIRLNDQEILILIIISESNRINLSKISEFLNISKPQISRVIYKLTTLNLINSTDLIETVDRRAVLLKLTEYGMAILNKIIQNFINVTNNIFSNNSQTIEFRSYLDKVLNEKLNLDHILIRSLMK